MINNYKMNIKTNKTLRKLKKLYKRKSKNLNKKKPQLKIKKK
jgi:hypothetical protein